MEWLTRRFAELRAPDPMMDDLLSGTRPQGRFASLTRWPPATLDPGNRRSSRLDIGPVALRFAHASCAPPAHPAP